MFDILQDILIITDTGKVLASRINNPQIEEQLFGMLLSALSSFAKEITEGELNHVEFSNLRFDFIRKQGFIFLASSSKSIKHKKAFKMLDYISNLFFERYPKEKLNEWDGNINIFHDLEDYITKSKDELFIELLFKDHKVS